ncbi:PaaI family thioesterase [Marinibactrum halimedae]|uniref:Thioesterase n=1 Tax=Marinibactrum halimedae TaxID=1444977 RepID=A0AA37T3C1_9GAMM|nr:PaaI family thioesterase [Marinibactrum halimedae]MCD9461188.1 PaaI family thioesterase [Marinibactrum halimedae]GLS26189.1 thioesterase [Marinibactrum halimedae]
MRDFHVYINRARRNNDPESLTRAIPYAQTLGVRATTMNNQCRFYLPPQASNVGNPTLPALHGGAIAGFMEVSAALYLLLSEPVPHIPRVVDFSIDYLRAGRVQTTFADCEILRRGRRLANLSIRAWQDHPDQVIASARVHFLFKPL